ncbi:helix-turn-helix domain-containing protein [Mycobacterium intracellulare]|uniref:helix-turn-helix domain-containing protein n=1 Tax=Mycobacterium intracellulare TaxID=1767 RepID=UPI0023B0AA64|nr:helix-turn-helix domain-containing protein [Mycobacterium intracellulare]MEE3754564.1 helix-turn-helix domain-containing protein [Mycobacterium intracellulare]
MLHFVAVLHPVFDDRGYRLPEPSEIVSRLLARLQSARERAGISPDDLASDLILGPGWIERFESGASVPDIDTLYVLIDRIGVDPAAIFAEAHDESAEASAAELSRLIRAEEVGGDLVIHFTYANHDAQYRLAGATLEQFEEVLLTLRNGLARLVAVDTDRNAETQIKTSAVASAFMKAVSLWPQANPSDVWWFIIYRAYCDPYNHPAAYARLSFEQSWKRTGGWALEEICVRHYAPELAKHGITIEIATGHRKQTLLSELKIGRRLIVDKVDVILTGPDDVVFGVVHVKASFAERRTDDVPMSEALVKSGYFSPLWTMDCKSGPSPRPYNRGELGSATGNRSEKRVGIEDEAEFSACYSYNRNTAPTAHPPERAADIVLCDFNNPNDSFTKGVLAGWQKFQSSRK